MATGVRSRYHVAIDGKGFMLYGAPMTPRYVKERAPTLVNQLGTGDLDYNNLNGSGWSFWTQTDWSGGFGTIKFNDDASFKDGQAVDVIKKYGEAVLQYGFSSAAQISGSHSYGAHAVHSLDLILGSVKNAGAKIFKLTSGGTLSTLSAMTTISGVNTMTRFNNNTIIGMTKQTAASASVKSLAKYNGTVISGFRSANPVVRAARGIGIRLYTGERVASLSGDVLYYSTDLTTFTSAYQAGKNRNIQKIWDVNGAPYFFVVEGKRVEMFRWDEFAERAYPIYKWENLTNFGVTSYISYMIITGTSNNQSTAFAFNGARLWEIFDDQLRDTSYDFSRPFEFEGNLQTKGGTWDGEFWFPGIYGKLDASRTYTPFENFNNRAYGYVTSGTKLFLGYRDTTKYAISGHIESSEFGSNIAGVDKLINSVDVNFDALATGQTIEILRSTNGGSSYSSVGKASFAQDGAVVKKTLFFPSGSVTKLWSYKAQLVGPGTSTPKLNDVTFQYRPVPDMKRRWSLSIDAGDNVKLLNNKHEERDGKALAADLWLNMDSKRTVTYEDIDSFEVSLVSAMTAAATSAIVSDTRLMPPRGRMRIKRNNASEEMTYTSADGGQIKGIARALKGTLAAAYTSADKVDNYYTVFITDMTEQVNDTDDKKTESISRVVLLEV